MFKNVAAQSGTLYALDVSTGLAKTGDAANMVFYIAKDDGNTNAISGNSGVPTECDATNAKGLYKIALSQNETNADKLTLSGKSVTNNVIVQPTVIYTLPYIVDLYHADIQFVRDQSNTQDEWTITWFKNGVRITSGITSPTLELIKRVDGTDLVGATSLTQIGSTGSYKVDLTSSNRVTVGEAVIAVVAATIDGATRSFSRVVGRDSS